MNGTNYEVPHYGAFSTPHSHPYWAQIFASGSCFQIPLAWIFILFCELIEQVAVFIHKIYLLISSSLSSGGACALTLPPI